MKTKLLILPFVLCFMLSACFSYRFRNAENMPVEKKFDLAHVITFDLSIPADYHQQTILGSLAKESGSEFTFFGKDITDSNYCNPTHKLIPGKTYVVKLIPMKVVVSSKDCLEMMVQQKGVLPVGAQGLAVLYTLAKDKFPNDKLVHSFDTPDHLWKSSGYGMTPHMNIGSSGSWFWSSPFNIPINKGQYLLCFCDK